MATSQYPTFQWPDEYTTLANWFWDPISDNVDRMDDLIAGQLSTAPHRVSTSFGDGTPLNFGTRDIPGEAAGWLNSLDSNLLQWGDWITTDPRDKFQTYFDQFASGDPFYNVDSSYQDVSANIGMLQSALSREAISQKLTSLGISDAGVQEALSGLYTEASGPLTQSSWDGPYSANTGIAGSPVASGPLASLFTDLGLELGGVGTSPFELDRTATNITDDSLLAALEAAGITPEELSAVTETPLTETLPVANLSQEAAMASNTDGVRPTALNPGASWLYGLFGKTLTGFDKNGNPVFKDNEDAIFGDTQRDQLAEFLTPLERNDIEDYGRDLLLRENLQSGFDETRRVFDEEVLPGLSDLTETGFRTATPDLYGERQYGFANRLLNNPVYGANQVDYATQNLTGPLYGQDQFDYANRNLTGPLYGAAQDAEALRMTNRPIYSQQASDLASEMMSKGIPKATRDAAYADFNQHEAQDIRAQNVGQTGSFSTDYLGALARGTADITNQLAQDSAEYQERGLNISNRMGEGQRIADQAALGTRNRMTENARSAQDRSLEFLNTMDEETRTGQDRSLGFLNLMSSGERDASESALGILNQMTQGQAALDADLSESAANRRVTGLDELGSASTVRSQLPLTWGQDVSNAGGALRLTDENMRPGGRVLDIFQSLLTGAAPSNLGYVAQGELPSGTTSLLTGWTPPSAAYGGGGSSSGFFSGLGNSLGRGLGSWLGSGASSLLSSAWNGISGLWGDDDSSSSDYYDYNDSSSNNRYWV